MSPTQADNLPAEPIKLNPIRETLYDENNYWTWLSKIKSALETHNLQDLTNPTIPRPIDPSPQYEHWKRTSQHVGLWLRMNLSPAVLKTLKTTLYADDTFSIIQTLILGDMSVRPKQVWKKAISTRRCQFATVEEYVETFRLLVHEANVLKAPISGYCAAMLLLGEVRGGNAALGVSDGVESYGG
ncbi:hypothetical protein AWENTII_010605 [Aspergillus wentii]